ncbi:GNAT family N-acetyltransferase [Pelagicoccus mobilis]|uniref:GNAT family N-acetyltransferase n=1 Tax=Pelagicoccus mobilis TaxID=415221 RepID=A0A934S0D1_9BACT|nr:GNAT family N-acetyltransferase [Pelagicoccus mobilis]MBK1876783.1 GNAT family N-acetyltransferase [Pelagicoccus mobilis]
MNNLGYKSDCLIQQYAGEVEAKPRYTVIRSTKNPDYHWGNLLVYGQAPKADSFKKWIQDFQSEFDQSTEHLTFGWEEESRGNTAHFEDLGFELEHNIVLTSNAPTPLVKSSAPIECRKLQSDEEWEAIAQLQSLCERDSPNWKPFLEFKRRLYNSYRQLQEAKHGACWGAFLEGTLVADMGLFFNSDRSYGRFQSVETHPEHQGQGICSELLSHVIADAYEAYPKIELIIATEPKNPALRIYQRAGFAPHSEQYGVSLPRPLSQSEQTQIS